jgi:Putative transposase
VLQVVHRVITRHLFGQAGLKEDEADSGAVTLIQRFGSSANLNIHLHCLVLDGVYRRGTGGELKIIATILQAPVIEKILTHLRLQARAPPRAPARGRALQAA